MTTPTPQDIAEKAEEITAQYLSYHALEGMIATALAAERSRLEAECERLRGALQAIADKATSDDELNDLDDIISMARGALAHPATAERET